MSTSKISRPDGSNEMIVPSSVFEKLYQEKGFILIELIPDPPVDLIPDGRAKLVGGTVAPKEITTTASRTVKASTHVRLNDVSDEVSAGDLAARMGLTEGQGVEGSTGKVKIEKPVVEPKKKTAAKETAAAAGRAKVVKK